MTGDTCANLSHQAGTNWARQHQVINTPTPPCRYFIIYKVRSLMDLYYPALMNLDCTNEGTLILILSSRFSPGHAILKYLMLQYFPGELSTTEHSSGSVSCEETLLSVKAVLTVMVRMCGRLDNPGYVD